MAVDEGRANESTVDTLVFDSVAVGIRAIPSVKIDLLWFVVQRWQFISTSVCNCVRNSSPFYIKSSSSVDWLDGLMRSSYKEWSMHLSHSNLVAVQLFNNRGRSNIFLNVLGVLNDSDSLSSHDKCDNGRNSHF